LTYESSFTLEPIDRLLGVERAAHVGKAAPLGDGWRDYFGSIEYGAERLEPKQVRFTHRSAAFGGMAYSRKSTD